MPAEGRRKATPGSPEMTVRGGWGAVESLPLLEKSAALGRTLTGGEGGAGQGQGSVVSTTSKDLWSKVGHGVLHES